MEELKILSYAEMKNWKPEDIVKHVQEIHRKAGNVNIRRKKEEAIARSTVQ